MARHGEPILAAISGLMFSSITQLLRSSDWVAHSYRVLDTLDFTQAFFSDAEASERGYVATCKPSLISPFRHDLPQIYAQLASLRTLTDDNPAHRERMAFLSRTMTAELERMSATSASLPKAISLRLKRRSPTRPNIDATAQVFSALGAMESEERAILAGRLHDVKIFAWATLASCAIGVTASSAYLGFVFWLIRRETRRRENN